MNNNNNDNKISTTDNNTNTTDNNTASATSVHFDLTEEETDYDDDDDDEEEEEEEEEEVYQEQEVDYDDLLLQYALNESFETEQPVNPPHLLKISPIVVPDHVSSVTVFCCACMEHYPQHEMHLFKNCPHGLCKHRCAAMYTSPFCPECKASLIEEEEEEEEEDTEEQDTEEQTELKRMVDYTISQILKEIAEQEQQQQEEEEEGRRKRTKIH